MLDLSLEYVSGLTGKEVAAVEPVNGGLNSRVFKVTVIDGSRYAAKIYPGPTADGRNRMVTEFSALEFMAKNGVDCVPKPVVSDSSRQCAIFEFADGAQVLSGEATITDIDHVGRFVMKLNGLKNNPGSAALPNAAEACFSIRDIVSNLEARLGPLQMVDSSSEMAGDLGEFVEQNFIPTFRKIEAWCEKRITGCGKSMDTELSAEYRTLSPSDLGFHNCLRQSNGELVFLDFEYFGWDDPAKMISDFLHHPAMGLSSSLKQRFVEDMLCKFQPDRDLLERTETVFPLFGLKWCLIILNAFSPVHRLQRGIINTPGPEQKKLLGRQLEKAKLMLHTVGTYYENFPYRDARDGLNVT